MPPMRGVTIKPACGPLPWRMISKPRNIAASVPAEGTTPSSMVTRTSRSPSTRPSGLTNRSTAVMVFLPESRSEARCRGLRGTGLGWRPSDNEHVLLGPLRRGDAGGRCVGHVGEVVAAFGNFLRDDAADLLGLEDRARREVEERVLRFGAPGARHAGPGLGRLPVPEDAVAGRMRHRPAAAELVEQAAGAGALAEGRRRLLVLEEL